MDRPTWDETWMAVAGVVGARSICTGRKIGAVIVDRSNRLVSSGYNGPPRGFDTQDAMDCRGFCPRAAIQPPQLRTTTYDDCYTVHAEANAVIFADRRTYEGGTIYVTSTPCWECAKIIANSGAKRVVMNVDWELDRHRDPTKTLLFLDNCGMEFTIMEQTGDPEDEMYPSPDINQLG